jgi:fused signal recognition particle receptor
MGLFDKLKNLITRKKEVVEEVKDKYDVENVEDIEEENIEEEAEESLEEEIENKEIEDEEIEAEEIEEPEEEIDDEEVEEEESVEEDEPEEEVEEDSEEDDDDEEWAQFVQSHQSKVEEAKDIETYDKGLEKTRKEFVSKLSLLGIKYNKVDDDYFDELEEILINADVGVNTVMKFIDQLRDRVKKEHITDTKYLNEVIIDELFIIYVDNQSLTDKINIAEEGPTVILFVGVNGVGKTTTIAKVAHKYRSEGKSVMMIAGDTFRAGAVDQLHEWADRTGSKFYGKEETDPAGVIFDGLKEARDNKIDVVLIDTAGRLQNKVNLMKELEKINNVIDRQIPGAPHETLLVIDATTGQNGISQAKAFKEITNITGIVLTKMDGTAKGGIVLAIKDEVDIPVKFIGLGEKMTDLKTFDIENYIYGLFKDLM